MSEMDLATFKKNALPKIEVTLLQHTSQTASQTLKASMNYSLLVGGKRMRPLLVLASCFCFKKTLYPAAYDVACSLEMVHTYSLIHDDLPAMDNDDFRRGKKTNHRIFGAGMATLAGDALLTDAFGVVAASQLSAATKTALLVALSKAAGSQGMCAGQAKDLLGEGKQLDCFQLVELHCQKTAALIQYALLAGGILGGANKRQLAVLKTFGKHFGLAFQIYDDLKDVAQDEREHKNSFVSLLGQTAAKQKLADQVAKCEESLQQLIVSGVDSKLLEEFLNYLKDGEIA